MIWWLGFFWLKLTSNFNFTPEESGKNIEGVIFTFIYIFDDLEYAKKICWRYFFKALIFMPSKWIRMIGESFIRHPKEFLSSLGKSRDALGCSSDGFSIFRSSFRTCNLFWWYILPTAGNCCALNYAKGEKRRQKLIYIRSRFQGFM